MKDSRLTEDGQAIRRRRACPGCNARFTTYERVHMRELMIVKRSGRRQPFSRDKLERSVTVALRKRGLESDRVDRMISNIVRLLETRGETEIASSVVGELVMRHLRELDQVAFVRYASVYRDFRERTDFAHFLGHEGLRTDEASES